MFFFCSLHREEKITRNAQITHKNLHSSQDAVVLHTLKDLRKMF